ncbi:hypothetical protein NLU14_04975 [Marinobacter sp. 71-i]|uniref:Uncharacterized protein n=1 Tax=Marinobacter iranensis TaxID=2962607 RepID=A0ABT5Y7C5_9GAMM|nr:hypothetical protein [Marinobacter iranensis]MDF0749580.1 hypothetical protein [Marinobacter iranensis]
MTRRLTANQSLTETLGLDQTAACLVIMRSCQSDTGLHIGRALPSRIIDGGHYSALSSIWD